MRLVKPAYLFGAVASVLFLLLFVFNEVVPSIPWPNALKIGAMSGLTFFLIVCLSALVSGAFIVHIVKDRKYTGIWLAVTLLAGVIVSVVTGKFYYDHSSITFSLYEALIGGVGFGMLVVSPVVGYLLTLWLQVRIVQILLFGDYVRIKEVNGIWYATDSNGSLLVSYTRYAPQNTLIGYPKSGFTSSEIADFCKKNNIHHLVV